MWGGECGRPARPPARDASWATQPGPGGRGSRRSSRDPAEAAPAPPALPTALAFLYPSPPRGLLRGAERVHLFFVERTRSTEASVVPTLLQGGAGARVSPCPGKADNRWTRRGETGQAYKRNAVALSTPRPSRLLSRTFPSPARLPFPPSLPSREAPARASGWTFFL